MASDQQAERQPTHQPMRQSAQSSTQPSAQQNTRPSTPSVQPIIVHHLSGLRYSNSNANQPNNMLVRYGRHLEGLLDHQYPNVVVITGDLTETGRREDLKAVETSLRVSFARWAGRLHEHVIVVPGPRDINWETDPATGFQVFCDVFKDFALPFHPGVPSGRDVPEHGMDNVICYPIDTCYSPDNLKPNLAGLFKNEIDAYSAFVKQRGEFNKRRLGVLWKRPWRPRRIDKEHARREVLESLRQQFLALTEGARLIDLHAGRINKTDVDRFNHWAAQHAQAVNAVNTSSTAPLPLKILVSHHPFVIRPEYDAQARSSAQGFKLIADSARVAGLHLALHGHVHDPQLLSDMSLFEGPQTQRPIRQLGAPSLGATGIFNEITAIYSAEGETSDWRLDLRLIDLKAGNVAASEAVALRNINEVADKKIKVLERAATQRSSFELETRNALRRFAEHTYLSRSENRQERWTGTPLPQGALFLIPDVIRNFIFKGYDVRVRLLLKSREDHSEVPRLVPTYLDPAIMEGPDALVYPASVAAWSLVLGRTLTFPDIEKQVTEPADHDWIRRMKKTDELLSALKTLRDETFAMSNPRADMGDRYQRLHTAIEGIRGATNGSSEVAIPGTDIYQKAFGGPKPSYPWFICVPYPMRPSGGAVPTLPEIAVLDVGVREAEPPDGQHRTAPPAPSTPPPTPFTRERVEMLETLTEVIGMMLVTADALGKPRGIWENNRSWS